MNINTLDDYLINTTSDKNLNKIYRQIITSCKIISNRIKRAGLENLYGSTSITNFHGEIVKTLDVVSNDLFIRSLSKIHDVCGLVSEENMDIIKINDSGTYIVAFDPLDGSSNIDANINIGSIFAIYKRKTDMGEITIDDCLQPGKCIVSAGYCLYGPSTIMVIGYNNTVNGFTLDEHYGEFILTHPNIRVPKEQHIYSVNEGNRTMWESNIINLVDSLKLGKKPYSLRYIGSMVADVHRTLLYGGLFMYPSAKNAPDGKLRYLYEVAPMSYIMEMAGGKALINDTNALEYVPNTIHQRVPIIMGSSNCICNCISDCINIPI
ncbi:MAG: fructose-1,6-bisphosphatase, cytosolic-like [Homavirus sp.]|uniref:fructose-bisphosphatase n=1 Tax=Homavirus sp. TaxID=2487769 RepID=A0A3G5AAF3_9VIRU|nr:MAG: fructose-1,6-bisphosphatase, cytosolic-like [Homavirus sp.]